MGNPDTLSHLNPSITQDHVIQDHDKHFVVWGPDNIPIAPDPAIGINGVLKQIHNVLKVVDRQGYFKDNSMQHLSFMELFDSIRVEESDMTISTTMAYTMYIQENLERIARDGWTPISYEEFLTSEECHNLTSEDEQETLPSNDTEGWTHFGEVGVDAGMLMVGDPCYLGSEWMGEGDRSHSLAQGYKHSDGTILYCALHGIHTDPDAIAFGNWEEKVEKYGKTPNKMVADGELTAMPRDRSNKGQFSYEGCCDALNEAKYGQLNFSRGHAGAGVVFSSGFGDGCYDVYGKIKDYDAYGPRVSEVRIVMIGDTDKERMDKVCGL